MSDADLVRNLNALLKPRARKELRQLEPRGPLKGKRVQAGYTSAPTSGGIASPLTEKTKDQGGSQVADREYYPAGLVSSDGLFVLPALKKQSFTDANGAEVVMDFATPGTL
ncbi:hypothetical protein FBY03_11197 [Pseudomonas sp. SJZ079]|uniref:hypothetical protein n=1 Tax=Pseudomonas sp. SJZ079 TaxID=2572887 RepID=UPI001198D36C|nr:hypothetical protein [Pseudomonas sp. SJZ079]TWC35049.1 hypothetical protein FBY03_11197 [Pseudomonas sp. SJZ079]